MEPLAFTKMHGLGNDFVVIDARERPLVLDERCARAITDRHTGVGCDQLIVLEPPTDGRAEALMRIRNADGAEVEACGNAARCIGRLLMRGAGRDHAVIQSVAGLQYASDAGGDAVTVDMGPVRLDWHEIPLARAVDTAHVDVGVETGTGRIADPVCVNVGNPHAVFFVDDAEAVPIETVGPRLEHHEMFPRRCNIEFVHVLGPDRLRMRVWERGVGVTRACGTGACATVVAAHRRGLTGRRAEVVLDGGTLAIDWRDDGHVTLTGAVATSFAGTLAPELLR